MKREKKTQQEVIQWLLDKEVLGDAELSILNNCRRIFSYPKGKSVFEQIHRVYDKDKNYFEYKITDAGKSAEVIDLRI